MPNPARGEVPIELAGARYALRPTMAFVAEVEAAHGSLIGLVERFGGNRWTVAELTAVLRHGLAHEAGLGAREIAEAVHAAGPVHLLAPALRLCHNALTGGRPLEAEPEKSAGAVAKPPAAPSQSDAMAAISCPSAS